MSDLPTRLSYLKLPYIRENYEAMAKTAAHKQWDHIQYLSELVIQESNLRRDKTIQRRIKAARFPVTKTMDQFNSLE
jgi:DNA replication protein DnaC